MKSKLLNLARLTKDEDKDAIKARLYSYQPALELVERILDQELEQIRKDRRSVKAFLYSAYKPYQEWLNGQEDLILNLKETIGLTSPEEQNDRYF